MERMLGHHHEQPHVRVATVERSGGVAGGGKELLDSGAVRQAELAVLIEHGNRAMEMERQIVREHLLGRAVHGRVERKGYQKSVASDAQHFPESGQAILAPHVFEEIERRDEVEALIWKRKLEGGGANVIR